MPMVAMSWYLWFQPPPARYLKGVVWSKVAVTVVTAGFLVAGYS